MSRYIDADKIKQRFVKMYWQNEEKQGVYDPYVKAIEKCVDILDKQPTADVEEVRHAKFISEIVKKEDWKGKIQEYYQPNSCSNCHTPLKGTENYCHNCGAKMDGK